MTRPYRGEGRRKAVHIGSAGFALLLRWLSWWGAALLALAALAFNALLLPRLGGKSMWREEDRRRGWALGIVAYPISVLGFILLFPTRLHLAALLWGLLAFGDGFSSLIGRRWGRASPLPWSAEKSWPGLAAYVLLGGLGAAGLAWWVDPGAGWQRVAWLVVPVTLLAALLETWDSGLDDNLTVSLASALALLALAESSPDLLVDRLAGLEVWLAAVAVNGALGALAWAARAVDLSGLVGGWILGAVLWGFAGWEAWCLLALFFVIGSGLSRVGRTRKEELGAAQEKEGRRSARHAWANGGAAAWLAVAAAGAREPAPLLVALAGAIATAAFDTASSEGGMVWGRRAFLPPRLRAVPPGTQGAVSMEGTAIGLLAGAMVAGAGWLLGLYGAAGCAAVTTAALAGGMVESLVGARTGAEVDNELLNFLNTVVGAALAAGLWLVLS